MMPSAWGWYAGQIGEPVYEIACDLPTREAVIAAARREIADSEDFQIIEAQTSTAAKYECDDWLPFVRTRNHEIIRALGAGER